MVISRIGAEVLSCLPSQQRPPPLPKIIFQPTKTGLIPQRVRMPLDNGGSTANDLLYQCSRCKQTKQGSKFAGTKYYICKSCVRKVRSPKYLLPKFESRLEKMVTRQHSQHWDEESKAFKRLSKRIKRVSKHVEIYRSRVSVAYLSQKRASTLRGERLNNATPSWINEHHFREIVAACERTNNETGQKHHLDHIIPIAGKTVSGLHVPWNLQVLDALANCSKSNKLLTGTSICAYPLGDNPMWVPSSRGEFEIAA